MRAVRALGIDAYVNERNDICVAGEKMSPAVYTDARYSSFRVHIHVSGSAYKIVNNRAYHHGTMLISTRLDTLGDLLRTNKVGRCSELWRRFASLGNKGHCQRLGVSVF